MEGENLDTTNENNLEPSTLTAEHNQAVIDAMVKADLQSESITPVVEVIGKQTGTTKPTVESKPEPLKKRGSKTVNFSIDEENHINKIIADRKAFELSTSDGNFIRQCIDIAINADYHVLNGTKYTFAINEDGSLQKKALKDAFFSNHETNLPTFK